MEQVICETLRTLTLPPIILHPFATASVPESINESSRANLILQGLLPSSGQRPEDLEATFLRGRFVEVRMLYYVGKDLERWVEQCLEMAARDPRLASAGLTAGTFIQFLVEQAPDEIRAKLAEWGVADYRAIFRRAIGIKSMFTEAPDFACLTPQFIRYYYRYADKLYMCRLETEGCPPLPEGNVTVALYASGEYTRMLERQWDES